MKNRTHTNYRLFIMEVRRAYNSGAAVG